MVKKFPIRVAIAALALAVIGALAPASTASATPSIPIRHRIRAGVGRPVAHVTPAPSSRERHRPRRTQRPGTDRRRRSSAIVSACDSRQAPYIANR